MNNKILIAASLFFTSNATLVAFAANDASLHTELSIPALPKDNNISGANDERDSAQEHAVPGPNPASNQHLLDQANNNQQATSQADAQPEALDFDDDELELDEEFADDTASDASAVPIMPTNELSLPQDSADIAVNKSPNPVANTQKQKAEINEKELTFAQEDPIKGGANQVSDATPSLFVQSEVAVLLGPQDDMILGKIDPAYTMPAYDLMHRAEDVFRKVKEAPQNAKTRRYIQAIRSDPKIPSDITKELLEATQEGNLHDVKLILDASGLINLVTTTGDTLLSIAVRHQHYDLVEFFLNRGISPKRVNKDGASAISIAREMNDQKMYDILNRR